MGQWFRLVMVIIPPVMYHKGHGEELELGDEKYLIFKEHELIAYVSE